MGLRPQRAPIPTSQSAEFFFDQTEMIYQNVHKNSMQAFIKNKIYYDKKPTLKETIQQIIIMSYSRNESSTE